MIHRFRTLILIFPALALIAAGCGDSGESLERGASGDGAATAPASGETPMPSEDAAIGYEEGAQKRAAPPRDVVTTTSQADTVSPGPPTADSATRDTAPRADPMIIRNGEARVEVESLEPAIARVRQLAERLGGYVANTSIQQGEREVRTATLELKVPAARFDQALGGLRPIGKVETVRTTAEDVGEEFVDVTARMTNAQRLEQRLLELLENRTGRLEDVLAVERELASVRQEIERYQGRLRYLRTRVATSTLNVTIHEPFPVVGDYPGANPILRAFTQAWRNFVGFVAGFIASLGVLVPLGLLIWLAWRIFRKIRPRRPRPPGAQPMYPQAPPQPPHGPPPPQA